MALVDVKVPDIGDFKDVAVIELLVRPGDRVNAEQSLLTVESDKASMEIPSSQAGVLKALKVGLGDKVSEGSVIAVLDVADVVAASAPSAMPARAEPTTPPPPSAAAAAAAVPEPGATTVEVQVPDIGDFEGVAVIEVFVKPGDPVRVEQSLITVESDKASMEIPSSRAGVVRQVLVRLGDKVSRGSPIVLLDAATSAPAVPPSAPVTVGPAEAGNSSVPVNDVHPAMPAHRPAQTPSASLPHASPSIRKLARELGVPLAEVTGSGPKGRVTQDDLQRFVKGVMSGAVQTEAQKAKAPPSATTAVTAGGTLPGLLPWPQVDFAKFGPIERKELGRIKKISAANLHRNWVLIPHVTNHDDADITELEAFRLQLNRENEKSGIKVTMLAFLIKAVVAALKRFPEFNASLESTPTGEQLVLKQYFHIGFAADTPSGLVVPVIKDADRKGILAISQEMAELAKKARDGKLAPGDMSGGCFSISSLGGIGGRYFTPIINAPEVAILGVCRSSLEPKWDGSAFQPRLMLPLSLSWDHRVIDGAAAARFNAFVAQILADFRRVLL